MGIDLEQPSGCEDNVDIALSTNIIDDGNRKHAEKEEFDSLGSSEQTQGNPEANVCKSIIKSGDAVDMDAPSVDIFNKAVPNYEPQKGLEFESKEAAYSFYREYARSVGFGITIKASRRSKKSGKFIDVKIACSRFGSKPESSTTVKSRSCPKTGCQASMHMKRNPSDGKWFIYSFVKEHNHVICPDDFYYTIYGRNMQSGNITCKKKGLQQALSEGDVKMLLDNFMLLQAENPSFWYSIDLDQEKRMRNVFWVDGKGRIDYQNFCDVVFIDTYYVRNKYYIPFVPIVGVNHHFQFMLLGCGLIGDETTSTFVWLVRTWLRAVGGQTPRVIMTDTDKSLKEAIVEVLPDARHCFCLWHVLTKIRENLSHKMSRFENFAVKFKDCIYRSWTDEEFETEWSKMVDRFELREDDWIQSLYEDRKKWVPTYMRDTLLGGLSTAERSESISSFFDKYLTKDTKLDEFLDRYKVLLHDRYEEEAKADLETRVEQPTLRSRLHYEKQMSTVYTLAIFKKFQVEVLGTLACNVERVCENETTISFRVDDFEERQNFIVTWNEAESDICCLCRSFQYRGFLCRHAMIVLQMCGLSDIPFRYILKRWARTAKIKQITSGTSNKLHYRVQRFNDLCKLVFRLVEEGSLSQETYDIAFHAIEEALKHCVNVNDSARSLVYPNMLAIQGFINSKEGNKCSNNDKVSKRKEGQKKQKVQTEAEVVSIGMQGNSPQMAQLNLRAHTPDIPYVPEQDIRAMDKDSRTPNLDGYYGAEQSIHGMGRSSSLSTVRDYYSNQQGMEGLVQLPPRHFGPQQSLQGLLQGQVNFQNATLQGCFNIQDT